MKHYINQKVSYYLLTYQPGPDPAAAEDYILPNSSPHLTSRVYEEIREEVLLFLMNMELNHWAKMQLYPRPKEVVYSGSLIHSLYESCLIYITFFSSASLIPHDGWDWA